MKPSSPGHDRKLPTKDRRGAPRRKKQVKILICGTSGQGEPSYAWLFNRSTGGLGLSVSNKVAIGTILKVRPAGAAADVPWTHVEVKSCRAVENTWELGCEFVRTPSYGVLMLFG